MNIVEHFQRNVVTYTLVGMVGACFFIAGRTFHPFSRIINSSSSNQPTLYERVIAAADRHGNCDGNPDAAEMLDILRRAGYTLSFNKDQQLVAEGGTELFNMLVRITFKNNPTDPRLSTEALEKVLASYQ